MLPTIRKTTAAAVFMYSALFTSSAHAFGQAGKSKAPKVTTLFEVTIENRTEAQPFTPPVLSYGTTTFYRLNEPSSVALAEMAEDGIQKGFMAFSDSDKFVFGTGLIMPGQKETYTVEGLFDFGVRYGGLSGGPRYGLSLVSMLARTNDAFVGLDRYFPLRGFAGELIDVGASTTVFAKVYDSGSEENTESCDHVPAPPCDSHNARATENAEGLVKLHKGLNLQGDLKESDQFDPEKGALITIKRIR